MAGVVGIEPTPKVLETFVLPLNYTPPKMSKKKDGGGRGIRTPARNDPPVGFQDRSLQPNLGIPPKIKNKTIYYQIKFW
jgi:hypothetical protein